MLLLLFHFIIIDKIKLHTIENIDAVAPNPMQSEFVIDKSIPNGKWIGKKLTILNCYNGDAIKNWLILFVFIVISFYLTIYSRALQIKIFI